MSLNILFYQFGLEKKGEKTLNFWPKLLTNPFAKIEILQLANINVFVY